MKKISFILLLLGIFLSSCGKAVIMKPEAEEPLNKEEYGILVFSATFAENNFQELPLYFTLKGETGGSKEIRIDMKDDNVYVFFVKEGFYNIRNIEGENNSPAVTRAGSSKEKREIYTERTFGFSVKAGHLTYVGNIFFKDFDHEENKYNTRFYVKMESYKLTADIHIRQRMADISNALETYPFLKNDNLPVKIEMMVDIDTDSSLAASAIQKDKSQKNSEGYGPFAWGTPIANVKSILDIEKKRVLVLAQDHLVDHSSEQYPVQYYFQKQNDDFLLNQVEVTLPANAFDKAFASVKEKYGDFARKEENNVIWLTSFSRITLKSQESSLTLVYEAISLEEAKEQDFDDFIK